MQVFLIRHAKALNLGEKGIDRDEDRPLSKAGKAQARQLAFSFQDLGMHLETIVTSPLLRAYQTAEIIVNEWQSAAPELLVSDKLSPGCKPRKLMRYLRELRKESIGVVGHQPDLSLCAAWLIGDKKGYVEFAKGGAACINWESELKKGSGSLVWLVTPSWYRKPNSLSNSNEMAPVPDFRI